MKIEKLTVDVKYRVGLGNVEMPEMVYDQLLKAEENGHTIDSNDQRYPDAEIWLSENIREADCCDHEVEVYDMVQ